MRATVSLKVEKNRTISNVSGLTRPPDLRTPAPPVFVCASSAGGDIRRLGFPRISSGGRSALRTVTGSKNLAPAPALFVRYRLRLLERVAPSSNYVRTLPQSPTLLRWEGYVDTASALD